MKRLISITVFVSVAFLAILAYAGEPFAHVTLDIAPSSGAANIIIANTSVLEGTFEHPGNRSVLSFAVFDERFNVVTPVGIGKADPPGQRFILKPSQVFKYSVNPYVDEQKKLFFSYISGTAWFGYPLEKGKRYRVVAIYRPWGPDSSGVASDEMLFQF